MINTLLKSTILYLTVTATAVAITPTDPKYCTILTQLKPNMSIGEVFLLMGPPSSFGQPPNLDLSAVNTPRPVMQPQNSLPANSPEARAANLQSMAQDPILGAFMSAPPNSTNVLLWSFEDNTLTVSVKVKGSNVTDVNANFSCP